MDGPNLGGNTMKKALLLDDNFKFRISRKQAREAKAGDVLVSSLVQKNATAAFVQNNIKVETRKAQLIFNDKLYIVTIIKIIEPFKKTHS